MIALFHEQCLKLGFVLTAVDEWNHPREHFYTKDNMDVWIKGRYDRNNIVTFGCNDATHDICVGIYDEECSIEFVLRIKPVHANPLCKFMTLSYDEFFDITEETFNEFTQYTKELVRELDALYIAKKQLNYKTNLTTIRKTFFKPKKPKR